MVTAESLVHHSIFSGLDEGALRRSLAQTPATETRFNADQVLAIQGDRVTGLSFLTEGRVSASIESPAGKSLLVETLEAPELLAPAVLFSPEPVMPVTLTALTAGRLTSISREHVERLGEQFPSVYVHLLHEVGDKFNFLATKMRLLHFATLRQKTAGYILERERLAGGNPVDLRYGRERLAELFGVARPSLSRVLGEMVRDGLLSVSGQVVVIENRDALVRIAEDRE